MSNETRKRRTDAQEGMVPGFESNMPLADCNKTSGSNRGTTLYKTARKIEGPKVLSEECISLSILARRVEERSITFSWNSPFADLYMP